MSCSPFSLLHAYLSLPIHVTWFIARTFTFTCQFRNDHDLRDVCLARNQTVEAGPRLRRTPVIGSEQAPPARGNRVLRRRGLGQTRDGGGLSVPQIALDYVVVSP